MSRSNNVRRGRKARDSRRSSALVRRIREINFYRQAEDKLPEPEELRRTIVGVEAPREIQTLIDRTKHLTI